MSVRSGTDFHLREGISQADVLAHSFDAAREREKLAKRVSTRLRASSGIKGNFERDKRLEEIT